MSKKQKKSNVQEVAESVIKFFDTEVRDLSLKEYAEVIDEVGSHIDACRESCKSDMKNS